MKPAPFSYVKPVSVADALMVLDEHGAHARVLAGGQSLVPMLGMRLVRPEMIVDVNGLGDELGKLELRGGRLVVGALVRYAELERSPVVSEHLPLLQSVIHHIGDRQVRNRGTLGGAVAQADPTGEGPLACLTLDATIHVASRAGTRDIPVGEFFLGSYWSALQPGELLTHVSFPLAPVQCRFFERGRKHNDFALLSVAAVGSPDADGAWHDVRIGLGGVAETPVLATATAAALEGERWDVDRVGRAAQLALEAVDPPDDARASAAYRRHLVPVHVRRTLLDLAGAIQHG